MLECILTFVRSICEKLALGGACGFATDSGTIRLADFHHSSSD